MKMIWHCNGCGAQIPLTNQPEYCPLCLQRGKGFVKEERETAKDEIDKKYDEAMAALERYDEGCEPRSLKEYRKCC